MMLIPFIFNSLQFWIQDNILRAKKETNMKFVSMSMIEKSKTLKFNKKIPNLEIGNFESLKSSKRSTSYLNSKNKIALAFQ
jgi:hypothetical protein